MKKLKPIIAVLMGMAVAGTFAAGQEKTADPILTPGLTPVSFPATAPRTTYAPADVKILGTIDSGHTSRPVEYSSKPRYRAFVFEGNGHDQVEVAVTGLNGRSFVALTDSSLNLIASGMGHLTTTLPYRGPDTEAFYIVFKGTTNQPGRLAVHLKKVPAAADATR